MNDLLETIMRFSCCDGPKNRTNHYPSSQDFKLFRQQKSIYTGYFPGNAQKTVPILWPKSCGYKTLNFERLQSIEVLRKLESDGFHEITNSLRFTQTSLHTWYFTGNALNTVTKKQTFQNHYRFFRYFVKL